MKGGSSRRKTNGSTFTIDEIGLSSRQVWAATLVELARREQVGRGELESWLRPAALIGRDGPTLIIGAPNAVTRDRIATRFLPAVRDALGVTIGTPVEVVVVVAGPPGDG
jgi:chromosomal replication initiation ATPase DnaA